MIKGLQLRLAERGDPAKREWWERYMRGVIRFRGVAMPEIRAAMREWHVAEGISDLPGKEQRAVALGLLREPLAEDKFAGILLMQEFLVPSGVLTCAEGLHELRAAFDEGAVADWGTCDWLCVRVLGQLIRRQGAECAAELAAWRLGGPLWRRRASAVAFVDLARRGDANFPGFTTLVLEICADLAPAPERFLQTAVGWVLRDLSVAEPGAVSAFLEPRRGVLSREALRMATSRLPDADRDRLLGAKLVRRRR